MSLTPAETKATCLELRALRDALPLADAPIESALGYAPSGLNDNLRSSAQRWFGSWDVPTV